MGITEQQVRSIFGKYGNVETVSLRTTNQEVTAIVSYPVSDCEEKNYGQKCQAWAIMEAHG